MSSKTQPTQRTRVSRKLTDQQQPTTTNRPTIQRPPNNNMIYPQTIVPKEMVEKVCGLSDPFCAHAIGSKYPDTSSMRTLPYTRRTRVTLASDATGFGNLVINPQYGMVPQAPVNVYAGNVVTSWANFLNYPIITGVTHYRIVSAGFIVRRIVSPLNASGMVYIRLYASENGLTIAPIDTTTYNATDVTNVSLQDAKEIAVILPHTSQMAQAFYPVGSDLNNVGNSITHGFGFATVSFSGAPASLAGVLEIEFVTHFELIFEDGSELAQVATPAVAANSKLTAAAAHVTSTLKPMAIEGAAFIGKQLVSKATQALAAYYGGPAARSAAKAALAITVD